MHGNVYDASKDSKHLVVCFEPLFEFQVFVPERMSKEVKSNTTGAALEKPVPAVVSMKVHFERSLGEERVEEGKHGICVCVRCSVFWCLQRQFKNIHRI